MSVLFLATSVMFAIQVSRAKQVVSNSPNLLSEPKHPVTEPMWAKSRALAKNAAPNFTLETPNGKAIELMAACQDRPVVLVFTKDGCPCSIEAQAFFNQLSTGYEKAVQFYGVIDGASHVASKYRDDLKVPYDMLLEPNGRVFKAYKANQSTYTTLVGKGGQILKQWPGYSRAMLVELDEMLAKETGRPAARIDTTMAPEKMNSGCAFTFG